jgi:tRNA nucleotidyltransferase/poly(A) polymerase
MRVKREIQLPQDIINISNAYIKAGKEIFVVGGAVRDTLQNKEPKDYDLVTNALPEESKKILKDFNVSDEQGKNFGVLRVFTEDEPDGYEIASYRKDISLGRDTKGDDVKVEMGSHITIEDDCMRRDLTMNALFYDIKTKEIVDIVGGIEDIKNGVVRAVGDASERFIEDRLRIMRIFRFASRMDGVIDFDTFNAIKSDNRLRGISEKDDVSQERIWDEICKAFKQSKDFNVFLKLLTDFDMWEQIFPGVEINTNLIKSDDFLINITNLFKNEIPSARLENKFVQNFKMESNTARKIIFLLNMLSMKIEDVLPVFKKRQQCFITDSEIIEWLCINSINDFRNKFVKFKPSVNSQELMDKGITGRDLGIKLNELEIEKFKKML